MPLLRALILRKHALNAMHNGSGFHAGVRARSCALHAPHKSAWAFKMTLQHVTSELSSHILEIPNDAYMTFFTILVDLHHRSLVKV